MSDRFRFSRRSMTRQQSLSRRSLIGKSCSVSLVADSAMSRVERSWDIIANDIDAFGINFLARMFLEVPEALALFPFARNPDGTVGVAGVDVSDFGSLDPAILRKVLSESKPVVAHSRLVTKEVGRCVLGLHDMDVIVPRLRSLGRMHSASGVQPQHYDIFFRNLIETVRDALGPERWTEEIEEAWRSVHSTLTALMKKPADLALDAEMPGRWVMMSAVAGAYMAVATPLRLAGFAGRVHTLNVIMSVVDAAAVSVFAMELVGQAFLSGVKLPKLEREQRARQIKELRQGGLRKSVFNRTASTAASNMKFGLKLRIIRILKCLGIDQAIAWPVTDSITLCSFLLLVAHSLISNEDVPFVEESPVVEPLAASKATIFSPLLLARDWFGFQDYFVGYQEQSTPVIEDYSQLTIVGVHWLQLLGLLQIFSLLRVVQAIRCVENCFIIFQRIDERRRSTLRIAKLLFTIAYVVHLSACSWFLVAKIEIGPGGKAVPSSFFPVPELLYDCNVLQSYTRAVHWAWVQLAGIGDVDSSPVSTLECLTMLTIHICGATLYAVATGNVLSMLENYAAVESEVGNGAADLSDFMQHAGVPPSAQARIMQSYAMNSAVLGEGVEGSEITTWNDFNTTDLEFPDNVASTLPWHLHRELRTHALADAIARRDRIMERCSHSFRFALASSLREEGETLIPGDFLFRKGDLSPRKVMVVEKGKLVVTIDRQLVRTLRRGDILGVPWLTSTSSPANREAESNSMFWFEPASVNGRAPRNVHCEFLWGEDMVGATVRATDLTTLAVGVIFRHEVEELQLRFPQDFNELRSEKEKAHAFLRNISSQKRIILAKAVARRFVKRYRAKKNADKRLEEEGKLTSFCEENHQDSSNSIPEEDESGAEAQDTMSLDLSIEEKGISRVVVGS
uniref:Globin domain-containing protein n=1 Tax=Odontella aurita TaxID=265563 RepID=A0A7S4N6D6_9STRA|mmetsp:Transcript_48922/g.147377  ORF Transcript_48922/g.147377 Transcript_48922/m.147377 type:complete len:908 (+) Transcript_48922:107-2830(+)